MRVVALDSGKVDWAYKALGIGYDRRAALVEKFVGRCRGLSALTGLHATAAERPRKAGILLDNVIVILHEYAERLEPFTGRDQLDLFGLTAAMPMLSAILIQLTPFLKDGVPSGHEYLLNDPPRLKGVTEAVKRNLPVFDIHSVTRADLLNLEIAKNPADSREICKLIAVGLIYQETDCFRAISFGGGAASPSASGWHQKNIFRKARGLLARLRRKAKKPKFRQPAATELAKFETLK
jgi:hypothetical protein